MLQPARFDVRCRSMLSTVSHGLLPWSHAGHRKGNSPYQSPLVPRDHNLSLLAHRHAHPQAWLVGYFIMPVAGQLAFLMSITACPQMPAATSPQETPMPQCSLCWWGPRFHSFSFRHGSAAPLPRTLPLRASSPHQNPTVCLGVAHASGMPDCFPKALAESCRELPSMARSVWWFSICQLRVLQGALMEC